MNWKITYYSEKVQQETSALPKGILAHFLRITELIEEFGPDLGRPHTAPLGGGLFEIRARAREGTGRSVFCVLKGRKIVILLTVIKKTDKIPQRHMAIAIKRKQEVIDENYTTGYGELPEKSAQ